jgi:hypothetical protein
LTDVVWCGVGSGEQKGTVCGFAHPHDDRLVRKNKHRIRFHRSAIYSDAPASVAADPSSRAPPAQPPSPVVAAPTEENEQPLSLGPGADCSGWFR